MAKISEAAAVEAECQCVEPAAAAERADDVLLLDLIEGSRHPADVQRAQGRELRVRLEVGKRLAGLEVLACAPAQSAGTSEWWEVPKQKRKPNE